jgi:hypothetical protein
MEKLRFVEATGFISGQKKDASSIGFLTSNIFKGGPGSGNFGHVGRPGVVGGSGEGGGSGGAATKPAAKPKTTVNVTLNGKKQTIDFSDYKDDKDMKEAFKNGVKKIEEFAVDDGLKKVTQSFVNDSLEDYPEGVEDLITDYCTRKIGINLKDRDSLSLDTEIQLSKVISSVWRNLKADITNRVNENLGDMMDWKDKS